MSEGKFETIEKETPREEKIAQATENFTEKRLAELNKTLSPEEIKQLELLYKMNMFEREF